MMDAEKINRTIHEWLGRGEDWHEFEWEAFKKVMRQAKKGGHLVIQLSVLAKQMDAVLAEMEANNENS